MAKTRKEKNKKLYQQLDEEMKNNKENSYEEKLKAIDPALNDYDNSSSRSVEEKSSRKSENKTNSALTVIAKKVNGTSNKKGELVSVEKETKASKEEAAEETYEEPISYTDKLSVEAILRAKMEQQQKIKDEKKKGKKGPNDKYYTPSMMQARIKQHEGIDVRREVRLENKSYRWTAMAILVIVLAAVIVVGLLLIFKVITL